MQLKSVTINDIPLEVYYNCTKTTDSFGTNDNSTIFEFEIESVETNFGFDTINIQSLLAESVIDEIENQIVAFEGGK